MAVEDGITRRCSACGELKPLTEYHKNVRQSGGYAHDCKPCKSARQRAYRAADPDRYRANEQRSYLRHKESKSARVLKYATTERGAEIRRKAIKAWEQRNLPRLAEKKRRRRAVMPKWADRPAILVIYEKARALTQETGIKHTVDHIVPILSDRVCGLHCEANLQILTKSENSKKRNHYWPDMP